MLQRYVLSFTILSSTVSTEREYNLDFHKVSINFQIAMPITFGNQAELGLPVQGLFLHKDQDQKKREVMVLWGETFKEINTDFSLCEIQNLKLLYQKTKSKPDNHGCYCHVLNQLCFECRFPRAELVLMCLSMLLQLSCKPALLDCFQSFSFQP